jgi:hypothetical protein
MLILLHERVRVKIQLNRHLCDVAEVVKVAESLKLCDLIHARLRLKAEIYCVAA